MRAKTSEMSVDTQTLRNFWDAAMEHRRQFIISLLFPVGAIFLYTLVPLFVGKAVAALAYPGDELLPFLPQIILVSLVGVICNRVGFTNFLAHQAITQSVLEQKAMSTLLARSMSYHNNNISGKLVNEASDYAKSYASLSGAIVANTIPFVAIVLAGSVLVFSQSLILGFIITCMAAFAVLGGFWDSKRRAPLRSRRLVAGKKLIGHMADTIVNMQTVKTFAREQEEFTKHVSYSNHVRDLRVHDWRSAAQTGNTRIAMLLVAQVVFVVSLAILIRRDPTLLGIGIFSLSFTSTLFNRLFETFTTFRTVEEALLQASPMTQTILEPIQVVDTPNASELTVVNGAIAIQEATFAYVDQAKKQSVFSHLNIKIPAGQKVGLVGPSGGGKSTLTRLLLRFEDIQNGKITIDDQDISKVSQRSLRQALSYVPQEPLLFHRTIKENIAYGNPDAADKDIQAAAKRAFAHDFITQLAEGYDTVVGERGVKLSGGQRQRIAIARALLKNAPILILDEATSALDSESEALIQKALWELMKDRTALVVAHRLSTIQKMDRILVLDNGKIVEDGTHQELLEKHGTYAKLWSHQSGGFIEE